MVATPQHASPAPSSDTIRLHPPRPKGLFAGWRRRINSVSTLGESWAWRWRLPLSAGLLVGAWVLQMFSRPTVFENSASDNTLDYAGWACLAIGMGWRIWAARSISGRKSKEIVDDGAYSVCRNPLYVGTFFIGLAAACFLKSGVFLIAGVLVALLYVCGVVPAEERYLLGRHGAAYEDYCRRVWAWIPSLRNYTPVATPIVSHKSWMAECVRSIWWLALPVVLEATCYIREALPVLWVLPLP
ncbi:MAG TPA: isoprenylcysteine carboxylmethyltransferase family protein [Pirellulales bacterium]